MPPLNIAPSSAALGGTLNMPWDSSGFVVNYGGGSVVGRGGAANWVLWGGLAAVGYLLWKKR